MKTFRKATKEEDERIVSLAQELTEYCHKKEIQWNDFVSTILFMGATFIARQDKDDKMINTFKKQVEHIKEKDNWRGEAT